MAPKSYHQANVLEFARKWNLDVDMALNHIASYKRYMSERNLMGANYAYTEIRRFVREQHSDKKLSEFAKLFKPIGDDLKFRFGDLEGLKAAYIEAELKQRSFMEKAHEAALEEERKRHEEEERFSVLTDEELDDAYFAFIRENNTDKIRSLVNEAARRNGYLDSESNYQGEGAWAAPGNPGYETDEERRADMENSNAMNIEDIALGYSSQPDNYFTHPRMFGNDTPHGRESSNAILTAIDQIQSGRKNVKIKVFRAVPTAVKESKIRNGDWVTLSRAYAKMHGENRLEGDYRIIEQVVPATELWWDGNDVNEWGYDDGNSYRYRNIKNNRKLDDLITRDDEGHIIPLSKRFNPRKSDVRYFMSTETMLTEEETELRNTLITQLRNSGIDVITDIEKGQRILDIANDEIREHRKKKSANDTGLPENKSLSKSSVVSFTDTANIQQNLDNIVSKYEFIEKPFGDTFVTDLATAIKATHQGSNSQYVTIQAKNGTVVTIRLANHNATASKFDNAGRDNAISIVISRKSNEGITNDGRAHVTEYFYSDKKLRNAGGKAMADIARSLSQTLYSGEYIDLTGLAEIQEVNPELLREHRVYHGSGADFEVFDHSHIGEGEGAQAYGWGTYVTEVEGIGRMYAESFTNSTISYKVNNNGYWNTYRSNHPEYRAVGATYALLLTYNKKEAIRFAEKRRDENANNAEVSKHWDDVLQILNNHTKSDFKKVRDRHLYIVEIPDDNGSNYLMWEKKIDYDIAERIAQEFIKTEEADYLHIVKTEDELILLPHGENNIQNGHIINIGRDIYNTIESVLHSSQTASKFLHSLGFAGISYPAEYQSGGRADGAHNYIIFNEKDAKIVDHIKFFQTETGNAYGFTMNGKIYIDPQIATAETPIHEYTHLWAEMIRRTEPKEWGQIVHLMKDTPQWNHVKRVYSFLHSDDEIAEEALAHFSGKRGVERLRKAQEEAVKKGHTTAAAAEIATERVKQALSSFWNKVGRLFGLKKQKAEDIADRILLDMLNAVNPRFRQSIRHEIETRNGEQIRFHIGNNSEIKNGVVETYYSNGQMKERVSYKNGKMDGLYEAWYENGNPYVRENYKAGFCDGMSESWYENGNPRNRMNYKTGQLDGLSESWHRNGNLEIRTNHKAGEYDGLFESWHKNGNLEIRTNFKDGIHEGLYEEWHENGNLQKRIHYKDGKESGPYELWYENGTIKERANYKNWFHDGLYESWYDNGQRKERINYENGKRNGLYESWHENGQLKERINYSEGEKDGLFRQWDEKGQIRERVNFQNSFKYGKYECWHDNGQLCISCNFIRDKQDGLYKWWNKKGQLINISNLKNGSLHGVTEFWHNNGQLAERKNYKDGFLHGLYERWDETGKLEYSCYYHNNKSIDKETYDSLSQQDQSKKEVLGNEISPEKYNELQNGKLVTIKDFRLPNGRKKDVMIKKDSSKSSGFAFYEVPKLKKKQTPYKLIQKIKH